MAVRQHGDRAVIFGPGDPSRPVFAGDEPALTVAGIAVGEVGRARNTLLPCPRAAFHPAHHPVVRYVAPDQMAAVAEPDRPLRPAHPRMELFDEHIAERVAAEPAVEILKGLSIIG